MHRPNGALALSSGSTPVKRHPGGCNGGQSEASPPCQDCAHYSTHLAERLSFFRFPYFLSRLNPRSDPCTPNRMRKATFLPATIPRHQVGHIRTMRWLPQDIGYECRGQMASTLPGKSENIWPDCQPKRESGVAPQKRDNCLDLARAVMHASDLAAASSRASRFSTPRPAGSSARGACVSDQPGSR